MEDIFFEGTACSYKQF